MAFRLTEHIAGCLLKDVTFSLLLFSADHDEDGIVTKEEFVALPRGEVDDMMHGEESDAIWIKERRKEFEEVIDLDHDGKVGIEELKVVTCGIHV